MNNFSEDQIQELLVHGFTNNDIEYLQGIGLNIETLYSDIDHMLEDGFTRDEIMTEYRGQPNEAVEGSEEPTVEEGEEKFVGADEQKEATMNGGKRHKRKGKRNKTTRKLKKSASSRKPKKGRKARKTKRRVSK